VAAATAAAGRVAGLVGGRTNEKQESSRFLPAAITHPVCFKGVVGEVKSFWHCELIPSIYVFLYSFR